MTLINSKIHFILLAGGDSLRFSSNTNKLLAKFKNKNLLAHNIDFLKELKFKKITVVINTIKKANISNFNDLEIIKGGKTRSESVKNALNNSKFRSKYVLIHDAARPLNSQKIINNIIKNLIEKQYDCVVPFSRCSDTVILNHVNLDREKIKLIKTPQGFVKKKIIHLHKRNSKNKLTDDSQLFRNERNKYKIKYLLQNEINFKITYKDELDSLNKLIRNNFLAGIGYDIHKTKKTIKNNFVKLGGVKIKSKIKVISHSDGDVLLHAITDSILGALSQRDIGTYFPNTRKNLNRNSIDFLNYALKKMTFRKMLINNIDIMIVSEEPKINPHFEIIIRSLSKLLKTDKNNITIKATTNEKSGLIGSGDFIACWSSVSLKAN
ncbi:2-C-methyl-D-erythritol 2,4-cyclodiphosphate synthase [Alphaproteobacteria bacterium]|nr:2-C-methyl-D-erythritol 2,4-cyclodiphosphate synthase [Alphaproteobacteria bacterium]